MRWMWRLAALVPQSVQPLLVGQRTVLLFVADDSKAAAAEPKHSVSCHHVIMF
jgi:hypothetical protein